MSEGQGESVKSIQGHARDIVRMAREESDDGKLCVMLEFYLTLLVLESCGHDMEEVRGRFADGSFFLHATEEEREEYRRRWRESFPPAREGAAGAEGAGTNGGG